MAADVQMLSLTAQQEFYVMETRLFPTFAQTIDNAVKNASQNTDILVNWVSLGSLQQVTHAGP
jgi:hypothetical protein